MMAHQGTAATPAIYELAEGVLWDDRVGRVRWVDINRGRIHSGALSGSQIADIDGVDIDRTVGAVALAEDGGLLVAASRGLAVVSPEGIVSLGPDILGGLNNARLNNARPNDARLNDGSVDPQGRFVVGSLALGGAGADQVLLRVSSDGTTEVLRTGIGLSNGIAFSPDGSIVYHVDTLAHTVSSHSYGPGSFDTAEPWASVVDDLPHFPDGLAASADGSLWIAQWGGSSVRRHAPTGELMDVVAVDALQVSCPAFVGSKLDVLAITTAQEGLDDWTDQSGAIFLADVNATGLPTPRWAGSTSTPYWQPQRAS